MLRPANNTPDKRPVFVKSLTVTVVILALAPALTRADVDLTKYVAIGDSLTAGFTDGGLVETYQETSYPALLHERFSSVAPFEQPLVSEPGIPPLLELLSLLSGPVIGPKGEEPGVPLNLGLERPYDNMGIPGASVRHFVRNRVELGEMDDVPGLYDLIVRPSAFINPQTELPFTALEHALLNQPTFVTLWLGNNDVLGAATSGIIIDGVTLTTRASFEEDYGQVVDAVAASGAQMAVASIPDVTTIPFVTTLERFAVYPGRGEETPPDAEPLIGQVLPLFGPDGFQLREGDNVLLTASCYTAQGCGFGIAVPFVGEPPNVTVGAIRDCLGPGSVEICPFGFLPNHAVLGAVEARLVKARTEELNEVIRAKADEVGAAYVPTGEYLARLSEQGLNLAGIPYSTEYILGGLFSLDGVHPTALGYALVANEFIRVINETFGAGLTPVSLTPFVFGSEQAPAANVDPASVLMTSEASHALLDTLGAGYEEHPRRLLRRRALERLFAEQPPEARPATRGQHALDPADARERFGRSRSRR
ncbi:MAG: SGNH/GDSL hydrolase family protein [Acidobacteriota bacterium]|nr:MAG: SGNH/GDSL hydrolase family protein [Acidobacteriota bacterium]